jgi:hypothetical protein
VTKIITCNNLAGFTFFQQKLLSLGCSQFSLKQIGAIFGIDYSTVSQSRVRLKARLKSSRKLNKQFNQIKEQITNLSI